MVIMPNQGKRDQRVEGQRQTEPSGYSIREEGVAQRKSSRNLEDLLESWAEYVQGDVQGNTAQGWTTNSWERTANYPVS